MEQRPSQKKPTFEEALAQLRDAVQALEEGSLSLEEATRLFERGISLARVCNEMLSAAELQVTRLQRSFGEQMEMVQATQPPAQSEEDDGAPDDLPW